MYSKILYSFPIQLLANNLKRNPVLILCWLTLFAIVTGNFGTIMGIPFLFLDPEYLNETGFISYLILGITCGGFTMAFHISCYISDGPRYSFLGSLRRPFTRFCINNSIIPLVFMIVFIVQVIIFQVENTEYGFWEILEKIGGLCSGFIFMLSLLFSYFQYTNKDIFKNITTNLDKQIRKVKITRVNVMDRLKIARHNKYRVDYYLDLNLKLKKVDIQSIHYDRAAILKIFDQNHLNSIIVEVFIFVILIVLGIFRDNPYFQIPAAASFFLFLTIMLMIAGALNFWMRKWALLVAFSLLLIFNFIMEHEYIRANYHAFGLDYQVEPVEYSLTSLKSHVLPETILNDQMATLEILKKWRSKFLAKENPKMVFICTSGGGQRSALWTLKSLQFADSITGGQLMKNTMLMTGSSGGILGAAYYREIYLQSLKYDSINKFDEKYHKNVSKDVLNPVIFSLLVNDVFIGFQKFKYQGFSYSKDRGYAFEQQLNYNTNGILDKTLDEYYFPEQNSEIPMLLLAPNIINDGRKLFISPQNVSYLGSDFYEEGSFQNEKVKGIDFKSFFENQQSGNLRFLTALRMSATFPYITPNISLPSSPEMKMMDSGISDNFGVSDAVRFLYVFKDWISENTSGVIFLNIRDSEKNGQVEININESLMEKFFVPIKSLYKNFDNIQDINNDNQLEYARSWFEGDIYRLDIQYLSKIINKSNFKKDTLELKESQRASLSWRLTNNEKSNIISNIYLSANQKAFSDLKELLGLEVDLKPKMASKN